MLLNRQSVRLIGLMLYPLQCGPVLGPAASVKCDPVMYQIFRIMKERQCSDTSKAFLCDILSRKCDEFINSTKNHYKNYSKNHQILLFNEAEELRRKEEELIAKLMKQIIQKIKLKMTETLIYCTNPLSNKEIFKALVLTLQLEYESINDEITRVRDYTRRREIRDVLALKISCMGSDEFMGLVFANIHKLKEFFTNFQLEVFNNHEIQMLREDIEIIDELVDFEPLLDKRLAQKKQKKKNRKKNNKKKLSASQSTKDEQQNTKVDQLPLSQYEQVTQFLSSLVIDENRSSCHAPHDWLDDLRLKYYQ